MVHNEPVEPGNMELDTATIVVDESTQTAFPLPSNSTASAGPSFSGMGTVTESSVTARFLRGSGLSAAQVLGEVTAISDAFSYHPVDVSTSNDGETLNL